MALQFTSNNRATLVTVASRGIDGIWSNTRLTKTSTYTVANADKGKTVALGGGAFYQVALGVASGYDANFAAVILNEDTGRGKTIAINGLSSFILWPGQSIVVYNQNSTWHVLPPFQRWALPGTVTLNTDFTNGNDSNDGLATGAGNALKTVQAALLVALACFDWQANQLIIKMAAASTDSTLIHYAPHAAVGAQGGAAILIDGNGGTLSGGAQTYFGSVLQFRRLTIAVNGFNPEWGSKLYFEDGIVFGACTSAHMAIRPGARVEMESDYTIAGGGVSHVTIDSGGYFRNAAGTTATFSADCNFSQGFILASGGGAVDFNATIALGGHIVTGKRFTASGPVSITTPTGLPNTYFPGSLDGTAVNGANVDGLMSTTIAQGGTNASTAAGARTSLGIEAVAAHGDSNYTILASDLPFLKLTAGLTAARTWTLPLANSVNSGAVLTISDGGGINGANTLTVQRQGADGFSGIGVAGNAITLGTQYGSISVRSDGSSGWWLIAKNIV